MSASASDSKAMPSSIMKDFGNKYVLFPIKYASVWNMYKKAVSAFWTPEEIDLSKDVADWNALNDGERHFVTNILAFFAGSDGIVNENLAVRFMNEVPVQEVKSFYGFQIAMENIHCVTGSTRILTRKGYVAIGDVEGKMVDVWNGHEWSDNVTVFKTHDDAPLMAVTLTNGMFLECTPNHEWLIQVEGESEVSCKRVPASDLQVGDVISPFAFPSSCIDFNDAMFSHALEHGQKAFSNPELDTEPFNPIRYNCRQRDFVPINYTRATQVEWLKGALRNAKTDGMSAFLYHPDTMVLHNVQLMLTLIGVESVVKEDLISFCAPQVRNLLNVEDVGAGAGASASAAAAAVAIAFVEHSNITAPVYCFEEPKRHSGVFNGICTGQSETYSLLLDTYIKDTETKERLLNAIETVPAIKKKAEWALKWITNQEASFAKRLIAFACVEGIFFSGAFCAIFWLKERGVMPGLCLSNEFISRDESLHTEFAVHMYELLGPEHALTEETVHEIVSECVTIEDEFINESIPCNLLGMNNELMSQYIRFVADRLVVQLGAKPIYSALNPFPFMDRISLSNKSNFFEHTRQSEYAKARVGGDENANKFALDEDF